MAYQEDEERRRALGMPEGEDFTLSTASSFGSTPPSQGVPEWESSTRPQGASASLFQAPSPTPARGAPEVYAEWNPLPGGGGDGWTAGGWQGTAAQAGTATGDPIQQDKRARDTYRQLSEAGHQVKWQDDQLIIDGRPYVLGDGAPGAAAPATDEAWTKPAAFNPANNTGVAGGADAARPAIGMGQVRAPSGGGFGYGWDFGAHAGEDTSSVTTPKYGVANWLQQNQINPSDPNWAPRAAAELNAAYGTNQFQANGGQRLSYGDEWVDSSKVGGEFFWGSSGPGGGGRPARRPAGPAALGLPDNEAFGGPGGMGLAPWGGGGPPVYQAGDIPTDDIPSFTPESLQGLIANPQYDAFMSSLLANPSTLDERTVDTMKARLKDTLAEQQQFEEQDLNALGGSLGIGDSPWLASERLASRRGRDQTIAGKSADIDIEAAQTRQADRLNTAQAATTWQGQRGQQLLQTVNAGMQRAALVGDRLSLRESVKQAAAASGQSAQALMASWLTSQANLGLSYAQLQQQSSQFLEELMFRYAQLQQSDRQFGSDLGFRYTQLEQDDRQFAADRRLGA